MEVVVTSFRRLEYLKQCLESLIQPGVEIYVADGGSDEETLEYIKATAKGWILFKDNPGADFLKTAGIKEFVTQPQFVVSSDDLVFPIGFAETLQTNFNLINKGKLKYPFCACHLPSLEIRVPTWPVEWGWKKVNGVEVLVVSTTQVAGSIMDLEATKQVGYFPNYGKSGQGDRAISKRFRDAGYFNCYFKTPSIIHIGRNKAIDFEEYTEAFNMDDKKYQASAMVDDRAFIISDDQVGEVGYVRDWCFYGKNSGEYWDERFRSGHWAFHKGCEQSREHMLSVVGKVDVKGKTVLDMGCALGQGSVILKEAGAFVMGADFSVEAVGACKKLYPDIRFVKWDIRNVPEKFDVIIVSHTLEHMGDDVIPAINHLLDHCKIFVGALPISDSEIASQEHVGEAWTQIVNHSGWKVELLSNEPKNIVFSVKGLL